MVLAAIPAISQGRMASISNISNTSLRFTFSNTSLMPASTGLSSTSSTSSTFQRIYHDRTEGTVIHIQHICYSSSPSHPKLLHHPRHLHNHHHHHCHYHHRRVHTCTSTRYPQPHHPNPNALHQTHPKASDAPTLTTTLPTTLPTLQQKRYMARLTKRNNRFSKGGGGGSKPSSGDDDGGFETFTFQANEQNTKHAMNTISAQQKQKSKHILVLGSSGVLGRELTTYFSKGKDWNVVGADVLPPTPPSSTNSTNNLYHLGHLGHFIPLPNEGSTSNMTPTSNLGSTTPTSNTSNVTDLTVALFRGLTHYFDGETGKLDGVVCASGGWAGDVDMKEVMDDLDRVDGGSGGSEGSKGREGRDWMEYEEEYVRRSAEVVDRMMRMNFNPIVAGSLVGRRHLNKGGLFVIIGATAALSPTPHMIGYGSAKSAAHHYLQSWGTYENLIHNEEVTSVGILPLMIDTPGNRANLDAQMESDENNGNRDGRDGGRDGRDDRYSKMVKPIHIAREVGEWIEKPHLRPHSGSLVKVIAKNRRAGSGGAAFHLVR